MRADLVPGAQFPNYALPDQDGVTRTLGKLQGKDPVVLLLARGGYCPKEHEQHRWLAAMEAELAVGYCRPITISTDSVLESAEWRQRLRVRWPFLSDAERKVQQDLEIEEYTDPEHNPMIPHTVLLLPSLMIHKIYMGYWYWGRPTPEELRQDLRAMSMAIRPDWNLAAPGLREQWERGERRNFYPYSQG